MEYKKQTDFAVISGPSGNALTRVCEKCVPATNSPVQTKWCHTGWIATQVLI